MARNIMLKEMLKMLKKIPNKRLLSLLLTLLLVFSLVPMMATTAVSAATYQWWDLRNAATYSQQTEPANNTITSTTMAFGGSAAFSATITDTNGTVTVTGTHYWAWSVDSPNSVQQRVGIYVPDGANANSAILHFVDNSGWQSDNYPSATVNATFDLTTSSGLNTSNGLIAKALERNMIILVDGARSRADAATNGQFLGKSPATMADTKAALLFLRANMQPGMALYGKGNPDLAFVTGTSGGGALSVVLAASGNSPDYFPALDAIGAAGVTDTNGNYASAFSDAYEGTIAYCPINDLPMADQAYEFTYNATRSELPANAAVNGGKINYVVYAGYDNGLNMPVWFTPAGPPGTPGGTSWNSATHDWNTPPTGDGTYFPAILDADGTTLVPAMWDADTSTWVKDTTTLDSLTGSAAIITGPASGPGATGTVQETLETIYFSTLPDLTTNTVMQASNYGAGAYADYVNGLGLKDENGNILTATFIQPTGSNISGITGGTFKTAMQKLLEKGADKALSEWANGTQANTGATGAPAGNDNMTKLGSFGYGSWLDINGSPATDQLYAAGSTATIHMDPYLLWLATGTTLKTSPAFDNLGTINAAQQNENNLVGTPAQPYSHWDPWSWDNDTSAVAGVGKANTGKELQGASGYLQMTVEGQQQALQQKMSSPIPYLDGSAKIPYLQGVKSSDTCTVAPFWYVRHGMNDRDTSFALQTTLYYSLYDNASVNKDFLNFNFAWLRPHSGNYDTTEAVAWLDSVLKTIPPIVTPTASVEKLNGNQNNLTITVTVENSDGTTTVATSTIKINNNAAGTYSVGGYNVYVDTKGNDQIRECKLAAQC